MNENKDYSKDYSNECSETKKNKSSLKSKIVNFFSSLKAKIVNFFAPKGIQVEMLRYRPNKISSNFALFAVLLLVLSFCFVYSTCVLLADSSFSILGYKNVGFWTTIDILLNIIFLLFMFSASIQMKNYSRKFGIISIVIGAVLIIRPFIYNLQMFTSGCIKASIFATSLSLMILCGAFFIIAGIICVLRSTILIKYLSTVENYENEKMVK